MILCGGISVATLFPPQHAWPRPSFAPMGVTQKNGVRKSAPRLTVSRRRTRIPQPRASGPPFNRQPEAYAAYKIIYQPHVRLRLTVNR